MRGGNSLLAGAGGGGGAAGRLRVDRCTSLDLSLATFSPAVSTGSRCNVILATDFESGDLPPWHT